MPAPDSPADSSAPDIAPRARRLGPAAAGLFVFLFAFLLASFPARNPDLWGHLAAGRDLAHGRAPTTAVAHETADHADQTWAFDLACYAICSIGGPAGLVVVKAVLAGLLAVILLRLSATGSGWLIPAFCTGLAVLTLGSRLLLQPATASYLFLGVALWLVRPGAGRVSAGLLVLLVVLWANTDRWFVLGLGVIGLVLLGRAIDQPPGRRLGALGRAIVLTAVLAAAGLVNPAHVRAFELPWAGGPAAGGLGMTSPFRRAYFEAMAESPAGLAYLPLVGLGLLSFVLAGRPWRWERILPWAALAALSGWQVRFAPFFAIVGGPILAWNLQDFFARRAAAGATVGRRTRLVVAALAALFALAFVTAAWPGWLQGPPFGPRRWAIETPPGLERGAAAVCRWEAEGRLGRESRALHLSPDSVGEFAWFCPDHRAIQDRALAAGILGEPGGPTDWPARLREAGVTHLVVYDTDRRRLTITLDRLLSVPEQWTPLFLSGGVAVFGWRDRARPAGDDPFRTLAWDPERLAVRPAPEDQAPPTRPPGERDPRRWWEAFWKPAAAATGDRDEAAVYLLWAEAEGRAAAPRHWAAWQATQAAGLVAATPGGYGPAALLDVRTRLELGRPEATPTGGIAHPIGRLFEVFWPAFGKARGDTSPAALYLAVRAGRRAVAANPLDAQAHAVLGEAYLRLIRETREAAWGESFPELVRLRRAQAAAELNQAVALSPGLAAAHLQLSVLYLELGILDLALKHHREYVAAARRPSSTSGARTDEYRSALAVAEDRLDRLVSLVREREDSFDRQAGDLRVYDRALLASELGLGGKARDILLGSDISAFGADGMILELQLLAQTGRAKEVREWTAEEHAEALGSLYLWLRAQAFAAGGDYALARELCGQLAAAGLDPTVPNTPGAGPRQIVAGRTGLAILDGQCGPLWQAFREPDFRTRVRQLVSALRREADALTLRGLLALEEGDTAAAAADFRQALRVWTPPEADPDAPRIDFNGRLATRQALDWIESVPPGPTP